MFLFILIFFALILMCFSLWDETTAGFFINTNRFSEYAFLQNFILLILCIFHLTVNWIHAKKTQILFNQFILLPSTLIPVLIVILYCMPIFWAALDANFVIEWFNQKFIESAIILILTSSFLLLLGILTGKYMMFSKLFGIAKKNKTPSRSLDNLFANKKNIEILVLSLVFLSVFILPFNLGLKTDVIFSGGRGTTNASNLMKIIVPFASISSTILTLLSGIVYAYARKKGIFIVPVMDVLPRLVLLSRGFFLPVVLFFSSSSLLGNRIPTWVYSIAIPCSVVLSATALTARGLSSGGITGFVSGFHSGHIDLLSSTQTFLETNSNLGILSTIVALRPENQSFIDGFLAWLGTIVPIPSFLGIKEHIPAVAELLGITSVGIPMPVVGELYFQMGWLGLSIFFLLGWWLGRLEANIIFHTKVYGRAYWTHVLIWLSLLYAFIISFHSASRGASRVLVYSLGLIWLLEIVSSMFSKSEVNSNEKMQFDFRK